MKIEEIKTIVKLMSENDLTEFKIEAEDMHLCIKRGGQNANPIIAQTLSPVVAARRSRRSRRGRSRCSGSPRRARRADH